MEVVVSSKPPRCPQKTCQLAFPLAFALRCPQDFCQLAPLVHRFATVFLIDGYRNESWFAQSDVTWIAMNCFAAMVFVGDEGKAHEGSYLGGVTFRAGRMANVSFLSDCSIWSVDNFRKEP